jgi:uncharacterized protein (DUF4415 family)
MRMPQHRGVPHVPYKPQEIYRKMAAIAGEVGPIAKDRRGPKQQGGYGFRGIDDIYDRLNSIMSKHGVFSVPMVETIESDAFEIRDTRWTDVRLRIRYRFYADDGSFVDAVTVGEGRDSADKGANKAMSAAHKYALIQSFTIPVAGNDSEEEHEERKSARDPAEPAKKSSPPPAGGDSPPKRKTFAGLVSAFGQLMAGLDETVLEAYRQEAEEWKTRYNDAMKDGQPDGAKGVAAEFGKRIEEIGVVVKERAKASEGAKEAPEKKPADDDMY